MRGSSAKVDIAPWDDSGAGSVNHQNYKLNQGGPPVSRFNIPSDSLNPPPTSPGGTNGRNHIHSDSSRSNEFGPPIEVISSEQAPWLSYDDDATPNGRSSPALGNMHDGRRPSAVSSASSQGSSNNRNQQGLKKLQGWFGEDDLTRDMRSKQDVKTVKSGDGDQSRPSLGRKGRLPSSRNPSPGSSRPRTPTKPSSDVTPWLYQNADDMGYFGSAPVRDSLYDKNQLSRPQTNETTKSSGHSHRFPFHRHRHNKSSETPSIESGSSDAYSLKPTISKPEAFPALRRDTTRANDFQISREVSPSPPPVDNLDGSERQSGESERRQKRGLLGRLRRHKNDRNGSDVQRPSSNSVSTSNLGAKLSRDISKSSVALDQGAPLEPTSTRRTTNATETQNKGSKKESHSRRPFKSKRTNTATTPLPRDPNQVRTDVDSHHALWHLDTDLTNMGDIMHPSATKPVKTEDQVDPKKPEVTEQFGTTANAAWDAPDSWAVKRKGEENHEKLHEIDETEGLARHADAGVPHNIRLYKSDGTFQPLSVGLNSTAAELINLMGKKTHPQDDINRFQIVMQKGNTSRQLDAGERPLVIQKRLLEQAGYDESDHIQEIGREDNTYLCRFIFMPAKMIGYSSHDKSINFSNKQKFSNVDLQGRSLNTIPIALYQKSTEIVFLNLSHNLNLDVPKDFIQGCSSLREIRYTGNEASKLPSSFCLATRLTVLDVSNNKLESLDHAQLEQLPNLASLKVANNRLKSIPESFTEFKNLRSLNLSSNFLESLPTSVANLKCLYDLDVSFNSIEGLRNIGGLENLTRLWATNNKLSGRPEGGIANLKSLREVDIRFNIIDNIDILSQLPELEHLTAGHNSISTFEGSFQKIRTLYLDHNPMTQFKLAAPITTLSILSLRSGKLAQLPEDLFSKMPGLTKLILTKNHFAALTPQIGKLQRLDHLSIAKNSLSTLPGELGRLTELRYLDVRENNINLLPHEIWLCRKLETLNISSNCLATFPKPPSQASLAGLELTSSQSSQPNSSFQNYSPTSDDGDTLGELGPTRRPSVASSGYMSSANSSPPSTHRKGSVASIYAQTPSTLSQRKPSALSRTTTADMSPISRKDSMLMTRMNATLVGSLRHVFLADNRLGDDIFDQLTTLQELRVLNLSYNEIYEIGPRTIRRWQNLTELYLSGNDLTSLPSEDFEECGALKVLHINGNKFQVLPAELGKVQKLCILDVSSNSLKYNVTNWPYDWNWNWNRNLKYLNLSGNKRLEIKPPSGAYAGRDNQNLTDFSTLSSLRVLGLMDVTLMIPSVPDQTEDRRVRTSGSNVGSMAYGISDTLGTHDHLSSIDIVVPRLEGHDDETLVGLFDGSPTHAGGSKVVKYLQENFESHFKHELRAKTANENAGHALRRTYLSLNKELATWANQHHETKERRAHRGSVVSQTLHEEDLRSGASATVLYLHGMTLFVSNVGNAEAMLVQSEGGYRMLTRKHDPAGPSERARIREAGGFVSRQGKLNDVVDVSRGFGYTHLVPAMVAAPYISQIEVTDTDETILLASREMWDYLTPDFVVDCARSERGDLMRAAQKLRDLAIAFGASSKMTVMLIGVSDLRRRERARYRTHSMSMGPSGLPDEYNNTRRARGRGRDPTLDSKLARLDQEVEAPVGDVSLVFTDIKNSTLLWETYEKAMQSAIKMHNELMRRHLRLIGGYEVKTEGDAFMVAFPTVTSALLWCFTIQSQLLEVPWPQEILNSISGQEVGDSEGNILFKGLSVRMGIHWGQPVCETDPITRRMDYFGPMVNRAARISGVADGGQITVSSDFIAEVQRLLETHIESDRSNSTGSDDTVSDDVNAVAIKRELRSLSSHGFEVRDLGERRLKGLENPEYIYLMYPHSLAGRQTVQQQRAEAEKQANESASVRAKDSSLTVDLDNLWDLWSVSLRLEMLCSSLESPESAELKPPETALLERTKERGGEVTDRFLINFLEHQISRIETCITTLSLRNMVKPFRDGMLEGACPMSDILTELMNNMNELNTLKQQMIDVDMAPS